MSEESQKKIITVKKNNIFGKVFKMSDLQRTQNNERYLQENDAQGNIKISLSMHFYI
jgi:hypothetical protein